jgi:DNA-binding MarR family transcriptional regulator
MYAISNPICEWTASAFQVPAGSWVLGKVLIATSLVSGKLVCASKSSEKTLSSQVTATTTLETPSTVPAVGAWVALLRAHAALSRDLSAGLLAEHGLSINDYEALHHLARNPDGVRRVDLAETLTLTPSGVTRLLEGLEGAEYVGKRACDADHRVTYAVLTDSGRTKLDEASCSHVRAIRETFEGVLDEPQLLALTELLGRLPSAGHCPLTD